MNDPETAIDPLPSSDVHQLLGVLVRIVDRRQAPDTISGNEAIGQVAVGVAERSDMEPRRQRAGALEHRVLSEGVLQAGPRHRSSRGVVGSSGDPENLEELGRGNPIPAPDPQ
jgi:hypothetical protein